MAQPAHQGIQAEAIQWHIRLRDGGGGDDWDSFIHWLETDPAHSEAYDAVKFVDALIEPGMIPAVGPTVANDDWGAAPESRPRGRTGLWATGFAAVAALLLLGLFALPWLTATSDRYEIATAAGQRRTVEIGDGSSAVLNGSTRLVLDRNDPRYAELAAGEATFTVRHDAARPFTVVSGDKSVQDVGTVFNLVRDRGRFSVEVIAGAVLYNPRLEAISLTAGQTLSVRNGGRPVVGRSEPRAMAGWQRGQLSYRAAPLETVASDLSRSLGTEVRLDPQLAALPFTGSVHVEGDGAASVASLASTLGLRARRTGDRWLIEPHARAPR